MMQLIKDHVLSLCLAVLAAAFLLGYLLMPDTEFPSLKTVTCSSARP